MTSRDKVTVPQLTVTPEELRAAIERAERNVRRGVIWHDPGPRGASEGVGMTEQNEERLIAVLERLAGVLEKLAAVDRGERPDLEPTEEWRRQWRERYERESTATPPTTWGGIRPGMWLEVVDGMEGTLE